MRRWVHTIHSWSITNYKLHAVNLPSVNVSRKMLAKNVFLNLAGQGIPYFAAFVVIPILIKGIGTERFGILTLILAIVVYFNFFDFGLGRALTHHLSDELGKKKDVKTMSCLVWTSLSNLLVLGFIGLLLGMFLTATFVYHLLKVPEFLKQETLFSFYLISLTTPVFVITLGLRGILQAYQRFDLINVIQIPLGILTFVSPLAILPFSKSLIPIIILLSALRVLALWVYFRSVINIMPYLMKNISIDLNAMQSLWRFGGWMTVTNVLGPFLVYSDRFFLGAMISASAVTFYTTPYEVITKLGIIPGALCSVLFPVFSTIYKTDPARTFRLFMGGIKYVFLFLFPIILVVFTLAHEGLAAWISDEFAINSVRVLQWLTLGVFINSLAQIASHLIQGVGRPDISAKIHLMELPVYLFAVWNLVRDFGIEGAALAWLGRVTIDAFLLFGIAFRFLAAKWHSVLKLIASFGAVLVVLACSLSLQSIASKTVFIAGILSLFIIFVWRRVFSQEDRDIIMGFINGTPWAKC